MMRNKTEQARKNIKICFVALGAYPLLTGKNPKNVIGPAVHQIILAKELLKHNFKVTVITYDEGGPPVESVNNIEIIKTYKVDSHLNIVLKVLHIWKAMKKAKAHVYIHAGGVAGALSPFCRLIKKKFIYDIASDLLVSRKLINREIKEFNQSIFSFGTFGNWLDIKLADAIIVQSEFQRKMLKKNFGKDGFLIKMPFPLPEREIPERANPPIVLWVGAVAEVKQPELFVKLAEAIPEARFQMIGGNSGNQELYDRIKESLKRIPNFEFLGVIPFDKINNYFSRASILVNTSMFEGFPNAFIQAWMNYVPVVSLNVDPDELISTNKMGLHSRMFEQLVKDIKTLLKDEVLRKEMGMNGRKYVEREHDIANIIEKYINVFERTYEKELNGADKADSGNDKEVE